MGSDRPTLETVARAAGVSRMTVSNAYNRPDQLSLATRERVLAVASELGYPGPDPAARSLRRGRSGTVGVLMTERLSYAFTDPGMVSLMRGMATELGTAGQAMLLVPSESDDVVSVVQGALVDAFIICSMDEDDEAVHAVLHRRLPLVTVGHPRLKGVPFLGIDNAAAGGRVAEHLLGLGHRKLGVVGLPGRDAGDTGNRVIPVRVGIRARVTGFSRVALAGQGVDLQVVDTSGEHPGRGPSGGARTSRPAGLPPTHSCVRGHRRPGHGRAGRGWPARPGRSTTAVGRRLRRHRGGRQEPPAADHGGPGSRGQGAAGCPRSTRPRGRRSGQVPAAEGAPGRAREHRCSARVTEAVRSTATEPLTCAYSPPAATAVRTMSW